MNLVVKCLLLFGICQTALLQKSHGTPWTFQCIEGQCRRILKEDIPSGQQGISLNNCKLTCSGHAMLWPLPSKHYVLENSVVSFPAKNVMVFVKTSTSAVEGMAKQAADIFRSQIKANSPENPDRRRRILNVTMEITSAVTSITHNTDEGYTLSIVNDQTNSQVLILASTYFGARHGLETLSQLISTEGDDLIILDTATIQDTPAYPHRGITLDTSRNYYSLNMLKKVVDAMSYNKMNMFHWHISDTNSFPFVSRREPNMAIYGAYASEKIYDPFQVRDFVEYARIRGVKVIPELDIPAHVGRGWEWGEKKGKGRFVFCLEEFDWQTYCVQPPCGQLNPANDAVYTVLGNIYKDFFEVFDKDLFHFGGDEVSVRCWTDAKVAKEAVEWLQNRSLGLDQQGVMKLWAHFNKKAYEQLKIANGKKELPVIVWSSALTKAEHIDEYLSNSTYTIQVWEDLSDTAKQEEWRNISKKGYKMILSNHDALYLDCGFGPWVGGPPKAFNNWCSPYKSWQLIYNNNPMEPLGLNDGILGFEVCLWSEQVDENSLESRIWPRSAAMAERAWTNPTSGYEEAEHRMITHRQRMVDRGIQADALQPLFCYHQEGRCFN